MSRPALHIADLDSRIQLPRRSFLAKAGALLAGAAVLGGARRAGASTQGLDPFVGEIGIVAFNFAPRGWALCNGQILPIAQYTALFSLLGTTYGGNGFTTFALPDLRGRVPIHFGQGPGLSNYNLGQTGGTETETLSLSQMPLHNHQHMVDLGNGVSDDPNGRLVAKNAAGIPQYGVNATATLAPGAIGPVGGSQPHNNLQPYLTLNFIIALQGIFPSP